MVAATITLIGTSITSVANLIGSVKDKGTKAQLEC